MESGYVRYVENGWYDELKSRIEEMIAKYNPNRIVTISGLLHVPHYFVFKHLYETRKFDTNFVEDSPYCHKAFGKHLIANSPIRYRPAMTFHLTKEEADEKVQLFKKCYPSEVYLLRFHDWMFRNCPG